MKKLAWFLTIALVIAMMAPAFAAPLFPDVPEQHWARDAVADLAQKGILVGYPDGTFKGDRASTRWEMAMALHRLLAKMEAAHATFATKAELEALRALVNNLKDELDALGVRVKNLEENVSALDKRVTELERITFEGDFTTKFLTIGLNNSDNRTTTAWDVAVGSQAGVNTFAFFPGTVDMFNGRPLVNGVSFTAKANLGVKVKLTKDLDAGVRFAAFTSLGDQFIDAYWGVSAPYLSNPFTSNNLTVNNAWTQPMNNGPWTRMNLDKFWLEHKPSNTKLIVGSIEKTNFDSFVVANIFNPNISGRDRSQYEDMKKEKKSLVYAWDYHENEDDAYLPFYGIKVSGNTHFISGMMWEVMYSKLPHFHFDQFFFTGLADPNGFADITPHLVGANLGWKIKDQYAIKLNFAAVTENSTLPTGADYFSFPWMSASSGSWINPQGATAPLPMGDPNNLGVNMFIGTQQQYMYGLSFNYRFEPSNIRIVLQGAGTNYSPTKISSYDVNGWHGRAGIGWTNKQNTLDLDLEYVYTGPYYDPFQLNYNPIPGNAGLLAPFGLSGISYGFPNLSYSVMFGQYGYQIHDSDMYPNNRQGVRFGGEYRWNDGDGRINLRAGWLTQVDNSAPQLTQSGNYIDASGLIGYKPGFIETVFPMLALQNNTTIAENKSGNVLHLGGTLEHKFSPSPFKASLQYDYYRYHRDTDYAAGTVAGYAENNYVNLRNHILKLGLSYAFNDRFTLRGGFDWTNLNGYHVLFNPGAATIATNGGKVIDTTQYSPWLGFDYEIGKNTEWAVDVKYYNTKDNRGTDFQGANTTPYSFTGLQLMTQFKVKF